MTSVREGPREDVSGFPKDTKTADTSLDHKKLDETNAQDLSKNPQRLKQGWWFSGPHVKTERRVAVIGGGLAGMCAALEASASGGPGGCMVTLYDSEARLGGNSAKATSGINAAIDEDDEADFERDTLASCGFGDHHSACSDQMKVSDGEGKESGSSLLGGEDVEAKEARRCRELVRALVQGSREAVSWVREQGGVDLSVSCQCGGHSKPRTWRGVKPGVGFQIVRALSSMVEADPRIQVRTASRVAGLQRSEEGRITHVLVKQDQPAEGEADAVVLEGCSAVVLTTGGFAGASYAVEEFGPPGMSPLATTNGPCARGEGLRLGSAVGGKLMDLQHVQLHPTGFIDWSDPDAKTRFLAPESLRGSGGLLLNDEGEQFVNELARRDVVTAAIMSLSKENQMAHIVLDDSACGRFGRDAMGFYQWKSFMRKVEGGLEGLAEAMGPGVTKETLQRTIETHNAEVRNMKAGGGDPGDGAGQRYMVDPEGPFYVGQIAPTLHYTMGGLAFDVNGRVLDRNDNPVPGLFAAGEVTGGLHKKNRLAGNSLLECVVFGRKAGRNAGEYCAKVCRDEKWINQNASMILAVSGGVLCVSAILFKMSFK